MPFITLRSSCRALFRLAGINGSRKSPFLVAQIKSHDPPPSMVNHVQTSFSSNYVGTDPRMFDCSGGRTWRTRRASEEPRNRRQSVAQWHQFNFFFGWICRVRKIWLRTSGGVRNSKPPSDIRPASSISAGIRREKDYKPTLDTV